MFHGQSMNHSYKHSTQIVSRKYNYTYKENQDWRERFKWKGCIYGLNKKMPLTVPHLGLVFVLEMNNDQNKIMGIGLIRNYINPKYKMFQYKTHIHHY